MKNGVPRRQKRYTDRNQILKDSAAAIRKMERMDKRAAQLDSEADLYRDSEADGASEKIKQLRNEADKIREQAKRIEETRLPKLRQALDEMDTMPLGLPGYAARQVVLRPLEKR